MTKMVREYIEIDEMASLEGLIARLQDVQAALPGDADVKMRGDDVFGRQLCISYMRPQTAEESDCEARYAEAYRISRERELERLQNELGLHHEPQRGLRIVGKTEELPRFIGPRPFARLVTVDKLRIPTVMLRNIPRAAPRLPVQRARVSGEVGGQPHLPASKGKGAAAHPVHERHEREIAGREDLRRHPLNPPYYRDNPVFRLVVETRDASTEGGGKNKDEWP